ncbi:hypothetical protein E3226_005660 [Legionella geestiana]|uniref:hypothetical protein n=1 Tax=Legionella geestiana TaxID=45065 RepID=UPI0010919C48|nr:hypothetical protein [Legionella geestiana]QDQ39919.1 hypothetical protein E3226_005660 [Legionella geestiana]
MTANTARFFESHHSADTPVAARAAVAAGNGGNTECRALAAGLIECCMDNSPANQGTLKKLMYPLLQRHFQHFPGQRPLQPGLTPLDTIKLWLYQGGNSRLVDSLALTLREIAAETMEKHPEHFQEVFKRLRGRASTVLLHDPDFPLGDAALEALAKTLELPIELKVVEGGKTLHQRTRYPDNQLTPLIFLRKENGALKVELKHAATFARLATVQTQTPPPVGIAPAHPMSDICHAIDTHNKALLSMRDKTRNSLKVMLDAKEIDTHALLTLCIRARTEARAPAHAGTRNGSDAFFAALENAPAQNDLSALLIEAIARGVSLGEVSLETLFASLESSDTKLANAAENGIQAKP